MNLDEVGATPYGGQWWRREDEVIEFFDPADQTWRAWDGRLFGSYPPPALFRDGDEIIDEAPSAGKVASVTFLRVAVIVFTLSALVDVATTMYFALQQAPQDIFTPPSTGTSQRILTIAAQVSSTLWQVALGAAVAMTCLVAYRYIQKRTEA